MPTLNMAHYFYIITTVKEGGEPKRSIVSGNMECVARALRRRGVEAGYARYMSSKVQERGFADDANGDVFVVINSPT